MADAPAILDTLEATGATRFGRAVSRIVLVLDDGRRVAVELPRTTTPKPTAACEPSNETERSILRVLGESDVWMKRAAVAAKLGREDVTGSFAAAFRRLSAVGALYSRAAYYTDDPAKQCPEMDDS